MSCFDKFSYHVSMHSVGLHRLENAYQSAYLTINSPGMTLTFDQLTSTSNQFILVSKYTEVTLTAVFTCSQAVCDLIWSHSDPDL